MKNKIYFNNEQKKEKITPDMRNLIKKAINEALSYEDFKDKTEISITFVDNDKIRELNKLHRNIDKVTDVLSFPMLDEEDSVGDKNIFNNSVILGDIVLSVEKAKEQALDYGHTFERELAFLCVHSILHLLGYDHEISEEDEIDMKNRQKAILYNIGLERI